MSVVGVGEDVDVQSDNTCKWSHKDVEEGRAELRDEHWGTPQMVCLGCEVKGGM